MSIFSKFITVISVTVPDLISQNTQIDTKLIGTRKRPRVAKQPFKSRKEASKAMLSDRRPIITPKPVRCGEGHMFKLDLLCCCRTVRKE